MKRLIPLLLVISICLLLVGCGKSKAVTAVEDMIAQLGEITIDSEVAIINAETAYDRLSEKEKAKVKNYNILVSARATYDEIPKEIEVAVERELYAMTFENSLLGKYEYSKYVYNEKGQITQYYKGGSARETFYLEYNDDGTLASVKEVGSYGYDRVDYIYNAEGYVEREYWTSDFSIHNGKEFTYTYTFNDKGQVETKTQVNVNADYVVEHSYIYNEAGQLIRERQYDYDTTYIIEYVYDKNGNVIEEHISEINNPKDGWTNYYTYECIGTYTVYEMQPIK